MSRIMSDVSRWGSMICSVSEKLKFVIKACGVSENKWVAVGWRVRACRRAGTSAQDLGAGK